MRPPIALSIAGSDPSGGAGIQADLKTFSALGVFGTAVITALTAQNTQGVDGIHLPGGAFVREQITTLLDDVYVDATKIGMLANAETANAVADVIQERREDFGTIVLDPVMVSTSGDMLLDEEAASVLRERLLPLSDVITPNIPEAAFLLDANPATTPEEMHQQGEQLRELGARLALVKGGHLRGAESIDVFVHEHGTELLRGVMFNTRNTHGTGCTLSSAIAAQFAKITQSGEGDEITVLFSAREFLASAVENAIDWEISKHPETGHGPTNHLITLDAVR